jgi:hypothetical protein
VESLANELKADCAQCQALCCVASGFEPEQGFAFAKPAFVPCAHLNQHDRCKIHADLVPSGFPACVSFDCYGAGQRATQQWFSDKHWRHAHDPERAFQGYLKLRDLHAVMMLLDAATRVFAGSVTADQALLRLHALDQLAACDLATFLALSIQSKLDDARHWLKSLREQAKQLQALA